MKPLKIYIDANYPKRVVDILKSIEALQKDKQFEVIRWTDNIIKDNELDNSIFLVIDYQKRGLSIPVLKQAKDGFKTIVYRVTEKKPERFEHMMTILRVWPYIFEKKELLDNSTLLTFKYGGSRLSTYPNTG